MVVVAKIPPDGFVRTWNPSRYLAAPAIPPPSSLVATPLTTWLAEWIAAPSQTAQAASPMPIGISPVAPKAFALLCTPGEGDLAVVAFRRADVGQDRPRHAVLLPDRFAANAVSSRVAHWLPWNSR